MNRIKDFAIAINQISIMSASPSTTISELFYARNESQESIDGAKARLRNDDHPLKQFVESVEFKARGRTARP